MKVTKRKTAIKCPCCKETVIGYKYPPKIDGFSCHVEMNQDASKDNVRYRMNGQLNINRVCRECEKQLKKS